LGAMILEKWEFPPDLIKAVNFHHDADALEQDPLTALIALSNILVISTGIGIGAHGLATRLEGEGLKRFEISQAALDLCMADLVMEMQKAEELLRL
jgi:HD-like signal output (HDOD) protein